MCSACRFDALRHSYTSVSASASASASAPISVHVPPFIICSAFLPFFYRCQNFLSFRTCFASLAIVGGGSERREKKMVQQPKSVFLQTVFIFAVRFASRSVWLYVWRLTGWIFHCVWTCISLVYIMYMRITKWPFAPCYMAIYAYVLCSVRTRSTHRWTHEHIRQFEKEIENQFYLQNENIHRTVVQTIRCRWGSWTAWKKKVEYVPTARKIDTRGIQW